MLCAKQSLGHKKPKEVLPMAEWRRRSHHNHAVLAFLLLHADTASIFTPASKTVIASGATLLAGDCCHAMAIHLSAPTCVASTAPSASPGTHRCTARWIAQTSAPQWR